MAVDTVIAPRRVRLPVSLTTGVRAFVVGAAAEAGGQQSLTLAIVAGGFVLAAAVAGPIVNAWLRRLRQPPIDHRDELISEQADFIEHLRTELEQARADVGRRGETSKRRPRRG